LSSSGGFFDVAAGKEELKRIETQASSPDFWNDQEAAQKLLQKRTALEKKIQRQEHFDSQISDAGVLFEFADEDEESLKELRSLIERLEHEISVAETEMLLAGGNDQLNAICTIHPGAGGTESQDWAEMLLRMYLKWAEQRGFKTEILDYQPGEEAGLKGVTFRVGGEYAYGLLSAEAGVHRLIKQLDATPHLLHSLFILKSTKTSRLRSTTRTCAWTLIERRAPAASTSTQLTRRSA
jgi:peptide chain release factor 2